MNKPVLNRIKSSLQIKMFFSYALVVLIPLTVMGLILYIAATGISETQTQRNQSLYIQSIVKEVRQYLRELELFSQSIYLDEIQQGLNAKPENLIQEVRNQFDIFQRMMQWSGLMNLQADLENIVIVPADGPPMSSDPIDKAYDFRASDWYREALLREGRPYIFGPNEQPYAIGSADRSYTFSVVRKINNIVRSKPLGVVLIDVKIADLARLLESLETAEGSELMILNDNNEVLYHSAHTVDVGKRVRLSFGGKRGWVTYKGNELFYNLYHFEEIGWRFVTLDPVGNIRQYSWYFRDLTILIGIFALGVALLISVFITRRIIRPLRRLQREMENIEEGRFRHVPLAGRSDEIGRLSLVFNRMSDQINTLINKVYKSEIREKDAQLKALHSQINPHFLYNTLDSMSALALIKDNPELARMSLLLANMFRYSISQGEGEVPLYKELEQIERYMEIQRIRYDNKFELNMRIDESLRGYPILKLTVQPIVENAIYHGLEMLPGQGEIVVEAYCRSPYTHIAIRDNGIGMSSEKLERIRAELSDDAADPTGIGIQNVHQRISNYYGPEYGLEIDSSPREGTTVTFRLPDYKSPAGADGS